MRKGSVGISCIYLEDQLKETPAVIKSNRDSFIAHTEVEELLNEYILLDDNGPAKDARQTCQICSVPISHIT